MKIIKRIDYWILGLMLGLFLQWTSSIFKPDEVLVKFKGDSSYRKVKVPWGTVVPALVIYKIRSDVEWVQPNYKWGY